MADQPRKIGRLILNLSVLPLSRFCEFGSQGIRSDAWVHPTHTSLRSMARGKLTVLTPDTTKR